jgi:ArsR family transcriptional regulator, cadmium/lead-responsive transcriptional repressor
MAMKDLDTSAPPTAVAAKLFRGLADPTRLAILLALADGERRVVDLVAAIGAAQSTVSGHLACLKDCGLVADRPAGRAVFYRLATTEVFELLRAAEGLLAHIGAAIDLCPNYGTDGALRPGGPAASEGAPGSAATAGAAAEAGPARQPG